VTLELTGVALRFGRVAALSGIDAAIRRGRAMVLLGPNGAGKSTLLRVAAGLLRPQRGRVRLDGRPLSARGRAARAAALGYLAQRPLFSAGLLVEDVVTLGRLVSQDAGIGLDLVQRTMLALELERESARPVTALSIGQQQRVAIARMLVQTGALRWVAGGDAVDESAAEGSVAARRAAEARRSVPARGEGGQAPILLLDEPFAALDPAHVGVLLALLRACVDGGCGVIAAIHDLHIAAALADDVLILGEGRVRAQGPATSTLMPEVLEPMYGVAFERCGETVVPVLPKRRPPPT
jgi:iron complex transport system ATP-binding protein